MEPDPRLRRLLESAPDDQDALLESAEYLSGWENPSTDALAWLQDACPCGSLLTNAPQYTPLYWAVANDWPLDVVRFLYELQPEALALKQTSGNCPLHAVQSAKVAEYLVEQEPDRMLDLNVVQETPLFHMVRQGFLPLYTPVKALTKTNLTGRYPLQEVPDDDFPAALDIYRRAAVMCSRSIVLAAKGQEEPFLVFLEAAEEEWGDEHDEDAGSTLLKLATIYWEESSAAQYKPPLQLAVAYHVPMGWILKLVDALGKQCLRKPFFDRGHYIMPIHCAYANNRPDVFGALLRLDPQVLSLPPRHDPDVTCLRQMISPLFTPSFMKHVLEVFPDVPRHHAAATLNVFQVTCMSGNQDCLKMMVAHDPTLLAEADGDGFLPIHLLGCCGMHGEPNTRTMDLVDVFLANGYEWTIDHEGHDGSTPFHVALECYEADRSDYSERLIRKYLEYRPKGLETVNSLGVPPLFAVFNERNKTWNMRAFLDSFPIAAKVPHRDTGDYMIHHIIKKGASNFLVLYCLEAWPEVAKVRNKDGMLPLHLLVSRTFAHPRDWDCFPAVLEAYPGAVAEVVNGQPTLVHAARNPVCPLDIVYQLVRAAPTIVSSSKPVRSRSM